MSKIKLPYSEDYKLVYKDSDGELIQLEATDEMRVPRLGDYFLAIDSTDSRAVTALVLAGESSTEHVWRSWNGKETSEAKRSILTSGVRLILKEAWRWPKWLKADYVFSTPSGSWFCSNIRPTLRLSEWMFPIKMGASGSSVACLHEAISAYAAEKMNQKILNDFNADKQKNRATAFEDDDDDEEARRTFARHKAPPVIKFETAALEKVFTDNAYILPLDNTIFDFVPPNVSSWQESLKENPELEKLQAVEPSANTSNRRLLKDK